MLLRAWSVTGVPILARSVKSTGAKTCQRKAMILQKATGCSTMVTGWMQCLWSDSTHIALHLPVRTITVTLGNTLRRIAS
eukprot:5351579-Amphidinium_carterae.2